MAQSVLDKGKGNESDTATLFRSDTLRLGIAPQPASFRGEKAANEEVFDRSEYDNTTPRNNGARPRRKPTADQEALAKKSGHQITDELDINGAQNVSNNGTNGAGSTKAQREMMQKAAAVPSILERITSSSLYTTARNYARKCIDGVTGFISDTYNSIANKLGDFKKSTLQTLTGIKDRASEIIDNAGTTVSNAWKNTKDTFSEYIGQPASKLANGASNMASSAWNSTKNFLGFGENADNAPSAPKVEAPAQNRQDDAPDVVTQTLSGEQNNPSVGFSLGSAFSGAVENVSDRLGLGNRPAPSIPTYAPALNGGMR